MSHEDRVSEHIRLTIAALERLKNSAAHAAVEAFRARPELLAQPEYGVAVMEGYQADVEKINAAIAWLHGLEPKG